MVGRTVAEQELWRISHARRAGCRTGRDKDVFMSLHPQAAAFLAGLRKQGLPSAEQVPVTLGRQLTAGLVDLQGEQVDVDTTDILVPGAAGQLPARTYRADTGDAARPLIVYFHGGGWVS